MKVEKSSKNEKKTFFDSKEKIIGTGIAGAVLLLLIVVLMSLELGESKLVVKNKTDLKLEYVKTKFVNEEEDADIKDYAQIDNVAPQKTLTKATEPISLLNYDATYNITFKFENHDEMRIDSGSFNENFDGKTVITFSKTDDPNKLKMKVVAKNGLLPSKRTKCNDVFTVDLSTGKVFDE